MGIYNVQAIKEVYFGDNEISKLQDQFTLFRARCFRERKFTKKENTYEEIFKFNRMVEKVFGFETFALQIDMGQYENAFTFPLSSKLDLNRTDKNVRYSKKHMKFDKDAGYSCIVVITYGLLMNERFTDREIFAIILHEIGHNFSEAINQTGTLFGNITKCFIIYDIVMSSILSVLVNPTYSSKAAVNIVASTNSIQKFIINVEEHIAKNYPIFTTLTDTISRFHNIVTHTIERLFSTLNLLLITVKPVIYLKKLLSILLRYNPIELIINHFGYKEEKTADTFVTMYGYASDLSSGLYKLHYKSKSNSNYTPYLDHFKNIAYLPIIILTSPIECHPETITRIKEQIKYLERELETEDIDPKMKKHIKAQIKDMNHIIDNDILKSAKERNIKDPDLITKLYTATMYDLCGGDIKELFDKQDNHSYIKNTFEEKIRAVEIK